MEATLKPRSATTRGKNEARRLRASGQIPAVALRRREGQGDRDRRSIRRCCSASCTRSRASTRSSRSKVRLASRDTRVLVKEYQLDPVDHQLLHADFYRVAMDKLLTVTVPIVAQGRGEGRQAAGRRRRLRAPRGRDRVPAGRHPREHRGRRHRADARTRASACATCRPRARSGSRSAIAEMMIVHVVAPKAEEKPAGGGCGGGGAGGGGRARGHQEGQDREGREDETR